jgi:ribonuclease BN (tRNA processing enzyme)
MASGTNTGNLKPFLDTRYFNFKYGDTAAGERIIDAQYWSSTEYVATTMNGTATVFGVNFADGRIKGYPRQADRGEHRQFVRYVRGAPDYGINKFKDNGDGTITDEATGLMWAVEDSGQGMDWQTALQWVQEKNAKNYLGYGDWRLPNAKELQSIVDYSRSPATTGTAAIGPLFQVTPIKDEGGKTNYPFYWTSTTHVDANNRGTYAAYVCFGEGLGFMMVNAAGGLMPGAGGRPFAQPATPGATTYKLMDVHGAGAQRSDPKAGNPADYPYGHGPQGDVVRINNFVRLVRGGGAAPNPAIKTTPPAPTLSPSNSRASSDFSVVTLGTGGPLYNPHRAGPSTLVRYKDRYFLVDMGNGTQAGLDEYGVSYRDLTALMLTHHHIDHNEEFISILLRVLLMGGKINLFGPDGTQELYEFTRKFYQDDLTYRASRTATGALIKAEVDIRELTGGEDFHVDGVNIRTAVMQHTIFTLAYRFEADGKSIVISGDTTYTENLIELAQNADILVMDSGGVIMQRASVRNQRASPRDRPVPSANNTLPRAHASLVEVATMAQKAGVKCLVLTHFAALGEVDTEATLKAITAIYTGKVILGDLMEIPCR